MSVKNRPHDPHIDPQQARAELGLTEEQQRLDALVLDVYGSVPPRSFEPPRPRPTHPCERCGISTRRKGLCRDCQDVTT